MYLEYSSLSVSAATTELTIDIALSSKVDKTTLLGGDLFPLSWKNSNDIVNTIPAEFIGKWMKEYNSKYHEYSEKVISAGYATKIDQYNFFAAGKEWSKAWLLKNVGKTIDPTIL